MPPPFFTFRSPLPSLRSALASLLPRPRPRQPDSISLLRSPLPSHGPFSVPPRRSASLDALSDRSDEPLSSRMSDVDRMPSSNLSTEYDPPPPYSHSSARDPLVLLALLISTGWTVGIFVIYPFPTTIPLFIGLAIFLLSWTAISFARLGASLAFRREGAGMVIARCSTSKRVGLGLASLLIFYWICLGFTPRPLDVPQLSAYAVNGKVERYFIAANLHDSEDVLAKWEDQLLKLARHLGRDTFISIYESNSQDRTKPILHTLNSTLDGLGFPHRITTADDNQHWWPYDTSSERIAYLASARNIALEPIQSSNHGVRLGDWEEFTKIIFLNDILFRWEDIVRLIGTETDGEDYDLACAMDFGASGFYDTWVARDMCGTPLRSFWPYFKDRPSQDSLRRGKAVEVASCWNGAAVFRSEPFLYKRQMDSIDHGGYRMDKRGWKMIDNATYPGSVSSPSLASPISFRDSGIQACDHSECFLVNYDLHRYYGSAEVPRRPRIWMNPAVKVAYEENWWRWQNVVLRVPVIESWLNHWSRGIPLIFVDWIFERFGRRRDYCTWAGLQIPDRCPPLPGAVERHWDAR